ncbi:GMC oxidoreductase [Punctularia strigosozonata HHB-11173 SS5]|uniref:GMC oxidoreductase n=1 Tax=Punctularia strigosozonata (strain HHB-11173) TaxID=741275 RepID=UPI00044186A0|nr:GMC oxidoreductase [Punctularia strigosozonata HHB-11173 SS5]EIN09828.1 GMC oxidoreductase [Punctularia strigosozonata HHB-11173 SS5]
MWPFVSKYPSRSLEEIANQDFDYIVVPGGTAGCVVASRLSENPDTRVLLLERGPAITSWISRVPLLSQDFRRATSPAYKWASQPLQALSSLTNRLVTGKALGGTSKINANIYHRSTPADYNAWSTSGVEGWRWSDVEPFFNKSETTLSHTDSAHRGHDGHELSSYIPSSEPLTRGTIRVIRACASVGIPYLSESNDPDSQSFGCTRFDVTLGEDGLRQSSFDAFLPVEVAASRKENLFICPGVVATSIHLRETAEGPRAVGVQIEYEDADADMAPVSFIARARREIVVTSGAIGSPQLLMLSGIGPADHLTNLGIQVHKDLPGVGRGPQDHSAVAVEYKVPKSDTLHAAESSPILVLRELVKFLLFGTGLFLSPNPQVSIFAMSRTLDFDSDPPVRVEGRDLDAHNPENICDIEIMPIPANARDPLFKDQLAPSEAGFTFLCAGLRPKSNGTVRLRSLDPRTRPVCDLRTFAEGEDLVVMRKAVRLALLLSSKMREQGYPMNDLHVPKSESDVDLNDFILKDAHSTYHYSSTCRMAPEDQQGVVDDQLRVHGVLGLRIADASVFPTIPATHLQAPVVMVGERCAAFMAD